MNDDEMVKKYNDSVLIEIERRKRVEVCSYCSSDKIVNSGTCQYCLECGTSNGCS